jgi:hypothetical protein
VLGAGAVFRLLAFTTTMSLHHPQRFRSAHPAGHDGKKSPRFDEQGGTRAAGPIGSKTSTAGAVVERDSDPPDLTPDQVIRVWKSRGALVVYEYKNGRRATKLTYPVKEPSRNFYLEGDVILVRQLEKRRAEQEFPELKEPDDTFSLFSLVMMLLGEYEEEKYKLGWQILKVSDVNWGGGSVIVQAVMFFDNVPTALKKRAEFSVDDLNRSFIYSRTAEQLESTVVPVIEFTLELSEALLGGVTSGFEELEKLAARRLLKASARAAMKRGLKKAFHVAFRVMVSSIAKASFAFLKAFAMEFWKDMHAADKERRLHQRIGSPEVSKEIDRHPIFKKAVIAGADAAVLALIKECLEKPMMKMLEKSLKELYPELAKSLTQRVAIYFTKEIVKLCTTEFASAIAYSLLSAWKESLDAKGNVDPQKFEKLLQDKLQSALSKAIKGRFDSWLETLAEDQFKDMRI